MANILVTGAGGQLSSEIKELSNEYSDNFFFESKKSLDITKKEELLHFVEKNGIDIIINTAAYTKVDQAESEEEEAYLVNHQAVLNLADIAKERGLKLVHISTDYVYDGKNYKPYTEDDSTNPQTVYGKSKLKGEEAILKIEPKNSIIIRTSWVYSSFGNNFVKTMLNLGYTKERLTVINDQVGTPTYAKDLAKAILEILPLIKSDKPSIYHYSNEGVLSWYDFAKEIMRMAKLDCKIDPIATKDYPTPASRPHFSLLNKQKIKDEFELDIPYWKDSLDECLRAMGERS